MPYLLADRNEMTNLNRGLGASIDASYQVSLHLTISGFRGEYFFLVNDQPEIGWFIPSFGSFGIAVSDEKIHIRKVNRRRTPSDDKISHGLSTM